MKKIHMYDIKRAFVYFLAKYLGIAESNGKYILPYKSWVSYIDREDDCIKYFEDIEGINIFPFKFKLIEVIDFGHDSNYRSYINNHIKRRQKFLSLFGIKIVQY